MAYLQKLGTSFLYDSVTGDIIGWKDADGGENLLSPGVASTPGTYGVVTVNGSGQITGGSVVTPLANGGTGGTDAATALAALGAAPLASPGLTGNPTAPTAAVGDSDTSIATTAYVQAEIANKRNWTAYTPTITALANTFTSVTAVSGSYMVAFGICHFIAKFTVTTKGTGTNAVVSLPFPAKAGMVDFMLDATERAINGKGGYAYISAALTGATLIGADGSDLASANGAVLVVSGCYPVA
jgi:hypothetical protein